MAMSSLIAKDIDQFIASYPGSTRKLLKQLRAAIHKVSPGLEEAITYGIPTFKLGKKNIVHFSGYEHHIGFYPGASGIAHFQKDFKNYKTSKGTVQFPIGEPLPLDLVSRIVRFRVKEEMEKTSAKAGPGKKPGSSKSLGRQQQTQNAKATGTSDTERVTEHIGKLDKSIAGTVQFVRQVIMGSGDEVAERIKWNNPSFYYTGPLKDEDPKKYQRDFAVFNLFKNRIMLVFPSGARVDDGSGFLSGDYADGRRLIVFTDIKDARSREAKLRLLIRAWLDGVEK
jgi:uncharacterized protein YdhG (YjbR/CyaY superfamily)